MANLDQRQRIYEEEYKSFEDQIKEMYAQKRRYDIEMLNKRGLLSTTRGQETLSNLGNEQAQAEAGLRGQVSQLEQLATQEDQAKQFRESQQKKAFWGNIIGTAGKIAGVALAPFTGGASIPIGTAVGQAGQSAIGGDVNSALAQEQAIGSQLQAQEQSLQSYLQQLGSSDNMTQSNPQIDNLTNLYTNPPDLYSYYQG
jgi:hypothetical protein